MDDETALMTRRTACRHIARAITIAAGMTLIGCAETDARSDSGIKRVPALLEPEESLTGALMNTPGRSGYMAWTAPVAVAAQFGAVYVADRAARQIFRYERAMRAATRFAAFPAGAQTALAVGPDLSLYVADSGARAVQHFASDGRPLRQIEDGRLLARPVAVVPDPVTAEVWVADSHFRHLVLFNSFGAALTTVRPQESLSIDGAAGGPHGLYLLDRTGRKVVVIGRDGQHRYSMGSGLLKDPRALAVDRFNRVFVLDGIDSTIAVFDAGVLVARLGNSKDRLGLGQPAALAIDRDTLYVTDSLPPAVRIYRIAPLQLRRPA